MAKIPDIPNIPNIPDIPDSHKGSTPPPVPGFPGKGINDAPDNPVGIPAPPSSSPDDDLSRQLKLIEEKERKAREEKRKQEEEKRKRLEEEAEARAKAEKEEKKRQAEEAVRKKAEEERLKKEEAERKRLAEEARKKTEAEAKAKAKEEARLKDLTPKQKFLEGKELIKKGGPNVKKGLDLIEEASRKGYADATSFLAFGYEFGDRGFSKDESKSVGYYKKFIEQATTDHKDYAIACYNLGQIYNHGLNGVSADENLALSYYSKAESLGYTEARQRRWEIEMLHRLEIEEKENKIEEEKKKLRQKKTPVFIFGVITVIYLFLSVLAIAGDYPFWFLLLGIAYPVYILSSDPGSYLPAKTSILTLAASASLTCIYFIVRAIDNWADFWMWFWIVIYAVALVLLVKLYIDLKD